MYVFLISFLLIDLMHSCSDIQSEYIMPSRKRNKGKDRKAKKAELEAEKIEVDRVRARRAWQAGVRGGVPGRKLILCDHGCSMVHDDAVAKFMDGLYILRIRGDSDIFNFLRGTFTTNPEVWNTEVKRMAINILIKIGTNCLLLGSAFEPVDLAVVIVVLEHYNGGDINSNLNGRRVVMKCRDLSVPNMSRRDTLKFFRKRTECSCLKKKHLEARKTLPKLGMCYLCCEVKERTLLMVCSKCKIAQYCSRECHIADWSRHKCDCDKYFNAQEQCTMTCETSNKRT